MAKLWITYSWKDNESQDIDFIAQELKSSGLEIKLDRWNIAAGRRLWEQIENFICSENESDAWLLIATENSLASEPCKEEFAYALDRALRSRGQNFPVIGLFLSDIEQSLIPVGIRTRLFVSITDPDWKERIIAATEGRQHKTDSHDVTPFYIKVHQSQFENKRFVVEVRPRAGVWAPFIAAIPISEKNIVDLHIMIGPRDKPTPSGALTNVSMGSTDNKYYFIVAGNQATPTLSYFIYCNQLPSELVFGVNGGQLNVNQFNINF